MTRDNDSSDDEYTLKADTAALLSQFLKEKDEQIAKFNILKSQAEEIHKLSMFDFKEDWQLSQFWYTQETSSELAREALEETTENARIGCIASPSAYVALKKALGERKRDLFVFEFDKRFDVFQTDFVFYDFKEPLEFPQNLLKTFDYLIIDPPFLSQECWEKTSQTARELVKDNGKYLVCTGMVMKDLIKNELGCNVTDFEPKHQNGLSNEFGCFINYKSKKFKI